MLRSSVALFGFSAAMLAVLWVTPSPAHAYTISWQFDLESSQIPNGLSTSYGFGQAWISYETVSDHLNLTVAWTALEGALTGIHIHGPAEYGVTTRTHIVDVFKDSTEIPAGLDLHTDLHSETQHVFDPHGEDGHGGGGGHLPPDYALQTMIDEQAYMVFHTDLYPDGEIRGQLVLTSIPEPKTGWLVGASVLAAAGSAGRRPRSRRGRDEISDSNARLSRRLDTAPNSSAA